VDCVELTDKLLERELDYDPAVRAHVGACARCARIATGLARLDVIVSSTLVVEPPADLQFQLHQLVLATPPPARPWWLRLTDTVREANLTEWLARRPQMIAAQGLAAVLLALASWQVFGWLSVFQPTVGDIGYALELVASSPAVAYVGATQIDVQSLSLWSLVALGGWLISENGLVGRRFAASGPELP
jgi:hypothetical protein